MKMQVAAVGSDVYWLRAVQTALSTDVDRPEIINSLGNLQQCIANLQELNAKTILLVDISGSSEAESVIAAVRAKGWKYVIAVAADPSAKQATSVLRRNLGYDYWKKTYNEHEIKNMVTTCIMEILAEGKRDQAKT